MADLLRLNLQHFSEEVHTDDVNGGTAVPTNGGANDDIEKAPHMIPKTRFDEVNKKAKELQAQLDALQKAQDEEERTKAEEQGEYQRLYQETTSEVDRLKGVYDTASARAQELEGIVSGLLDAKLDAIPEQFRGLVPDGLTPEAKLAWLTKAEASGLFAPKEQPRNNPIGGGTNPPEDNVDYTKLSPQTMLGMAYAKQPKK